MLPIAIQDFIKELWTVHKLVEWIFPIQIVVVPSIKLLYLVVILLFLELLDDVQVTVLHKEVSCTDCKLGNLGLVHPV